MIGDRRLADVPPGTRVANPVVARMPGAAVNADAPMTARQETHINDLLQERALPAGSAEWFAAQANRLTLGDAKDIIERLRAYPVRPDLTATPGRYALLDGPGGAPRFYVVRVSKTTGRPYVCRLASDTETLLRHPESRRVLADIAAQADQALGRYGQLIGRCALCHRPLTDDTSRALGLGPDCRKK